MDTKKKYNKLVRLENDKFLLLSLLDGSASVLLDSVVEIRFLKKWYKISDLCVAYKDVCQAIDVFKKKNNIL